MINQNQKKKQQKYNKNLKLFEKKIVIFISPPTNILSDIIHIDAN